MPRELPATGTPPPSGGWRRALDPNRWSGAILLYSLVAAVVCFWRLGATGLVSMEGMVMDGARHMLESGEWVVPRVYGEIYFYKPALAYWLASLPLGLSDAPSAALLRSPFAASGFVMGLAVLVLVGRRRGARAGLLSALASVTGVLFLLKGRMAEFDVPLTAGVGVAVAAACYNLEAERQRWSVWLLAYVALGVAFLSKGGPALLSFGPGLMAAAFAAGRLRRLFEWRHLSAALVFAAITGGYLWAAWEQAGREAFEQPLVEARARAFGRLAAEDLDALPEARRFLRPGGGTEPSLARAAALATVKPLLIGLVFMPWAMLLLYPLGRRAEAAAILGRLGLGAAAFLTAGTLMWMLTPTHETRYYLPLAVPLGIVAGLVADRMLRVGPEKAVEIVRACTVVAVFCAAATAAMAFVFPSPPVPPAHRLVLLVVGAASCAVSVHPRWRRSAHRLPIVLGLAPLCVMLTQYLGFEPYRASKRDLSSAARTLAERVPAGETVWVLGPTDLAGKHSSLFFYLDRPIRAFRPWTGGSPAGAYCLLTAGDLEGLGSTPGFAFREIDRVEHAWFTYRLGTCSGRSDGVATAESRRPPFG